jgi:hypothetical protein
METTTKVSVKDIVKGTTAKFEYASCGVLYYKIENDTHVYIFPVDMNEEGIGTTRFEAEYKAITLMRWIRKSIETEDIVVYPKVK